MADPRGFLKFQREEQSYRPVEERLRDHREVLAEQPVEEARKQGQRCMDCGVPFCQNAHGCPLGNLVPEWNELAANGQWAEALERLHATNNFPEFTSRLCPAPCESACVLGLIDDPVTIKGLERQIIDHGYRLGLIQPRRPARASAGRVAVIGSGPAGLAAAQELARAGHKVTVIEKAPRLGGLLRYGIPDFKMEKHWIDRRIEQMKEEGVVFRVSTHVGRDVTMAQLRAEYDAICVAIGAEQPRDLLVPGRDLAGIHFAMDYLIEQNRVNSGELADEIASGPAGASVGEPRINARDKRVIIIGGGDTGSDCLGTAHRQGALEVTQFELLPRPPSSRSESTPWPQWPMKLRSSHAHEEGGRREWSLSTKAFRGEHGRVTGLVAESVKWTSGGFEAIENSEQVYAADLVILAMGFTGPASRAALDFPGLERDARGNIRTDSSYMTSLPGVFAAGDVRRGASLIVWAIAEGRRMAASAHQWLSSAARREAAVGASAGAATAASPLLIQEPV